MRECPFRGLPGTRTDACKADAYARRRGAIMMQDLNPKGTVEVDRNQSSVWFPCASIASTPAEIARLHQELDVLLQGSFEEEGAGFSRRRLVWRCQELRVIERVRSGLTSRHDLPVDGCRWECGSGGGKVDDLDLEFPTLLDCCRRYSLLRFRIPSQFSSLAGGNRVVAIDIHGNAPLEVVSMIGCQRAVQLMIHKPITSQRDGQQKEEDG